MSEDKKTYEQLQCELEMVSREAVTYKRELMDAVKLNDKLAEQAIKDTKLKSRCKLWMWTAAMLATLVVLICMYANDVRRERDGALRSLDRCWQQNFKQDQMMKEYERLVIRYGKRYGIPK